MAYKEFLRFSISLLSRVSDGAEFVLYKFVFVMLNLDDSLGTIRGGPSQILMKTIIGSRWKVS